MQMTLTPFPIFILCSGKMLNISVSLGYYYHCQPFFSVPKVLNIDVQRQLRLPEPNTNTPLVVATSVLDLICSNVVHKEMPSTFSFSSKSKTYTFYAKETAFSARFSFTLTLNFKSSNKRSLKVCIIAHYPRPVIPININQNIRTFGTNADMYLLLLELP